MQSLCEGAVPGPRRFNSLTECEPCNPLGVSLCCAAILHFGPIQRPHYVSACTRPESQTGILVLSGEVKCPRSLWIPPVWSTQPRAGTPAGNLRPLSLSAQEAQVGLNPAEVCRPQRLKAVEA